MGHDEAAASVPAKGPTTKQDRLAKLKALSEQRSKARGLNKAVVVAEDANVKLNPYQEKRRQKAQRQLDREHDKERAEAAGVDYDRQLLLNTDAVKSDYWHEKKTKGNARTKGFDNHTARQNAKYEREMRHFKPDLKAYERKKEAAKDDNTAEYGGEGKANKQDLDRLTKAVKVDIARKMKHSRREFHEDADVDYINSSNERFNQKLQTFYNKHTAEIKGNLERGTAL